MAVKVTDWPKTEGSAEAVTTVVVSSWLTVWVEGRRRAGGEGRVAVVSRRDGVLARRQLCGRVGCRAGGQRDCPRVVEPSKKVTDPVGVPVPGATAATLAVKLMDWPYTEGLTVTTRLVVVLSLLTAWVKLGAVLAVKFPSPL